MKADEIDARRSQVQTKERSRQIIYLLSTKMVDVEIFGAIIPTLSNPSALRVAEWTTHPVPTRVNEMRAPIDMVHSLITCSVLESSRVILGC